MPSKKRLAERYIKFLLRHRIAALAALALVTAFFFYHLTSLRVATDFFSLYPPRHPYIQLYNQYRNMFGTANVLVCGVEVKQGDIYNLDTIAKIDRITQEIMTIDGCNAVQVASITHPKLKNVQVTSWGIQITPVMFPSLPQNQGDVQRIKEGIYQNEGIRGFYVSANDKAAAIFAGFWEEGVNPLVLYNRLQEIKKRESDNNTTIHFTGYPTLYAHIYHLAPQVYIVLGVTVLVMVGLLLFYFRTWQGVVLPTFSAGLSALMGLGFASMLGYNLDPLILVVPLIITARTLSHSVQTMARYSEEYDRLRDRKQAIVRTFSELLTPGTLSIMTDATGVLLIAVATIPLMRNLAFFCSFWIMTIFVTVLTLNPILLSFLRPPKESQIRQETGGRFYETLAKILIKPSMGRNRWVVLVLIVVILVVGTSYSLRLKVGNTEAGAALLFADHPYNEASRFFNRNFVGTNQLVIIAEGKEQGAIKNAETLALMEDFQRHMETQGGAGGTLTFTNMIKRIFRMFHEGSPKWEMIPDNKKHLGEIGFQIQSSTAAGEMDRWVDSTWTNATVTCFYKDYSNEIIKQGIAKAKAFIDARSSEADKVRFRLAGGLLGILAAVNEEVEYSYWASLVVVFLAVFLLCTAAFRSIMAGLVLVIPLAISQVLSEVFMVFQGIDLNINSLPVAATAVGIGVDYGIYLTARIAEEFEASGDYDAANRKAVQTTGKAIIFTATTLIAGVVFWAFVDLKFQAEMGLLLGLLMFLNMINALVLIPTLVKFFKPKFVTARVV
ncbi:MAG: MMPL family transporter [Deltaproteobacteria bacterium]|nr:MMPL family transporter [Deltaproteobacteria bacterium]